MEFVGLELHPEWTTIALFLYILLNIAIVGYWTIRDWFDSCKSPIERLK